VSSTAAARWTCDCAAIIGRAVAGSPALLPVKLWPGVTVSRLVPSESISEIRLACHRGDPERRQRRPELAGPHALTRDAQQLADR
jgi:hypothetical protein